MHILERTPHDPSEDWPVTDDGVTPSGLGHDDHPDQRLVIPDDLVTDKALEDPAGDEFHHTAIAKGVADLALSSVTPVNIALFGAWGSGKSTLYELMKKRAEKQAPRVKVLRYDAWKYGGQELKRNFIQEIADKAELKDRSDLDQELMFNQEQSQLHLRRWLKNNRGSIGGAFVLALAAAVLWTGIRTGVEKKWMTPKTDFWDIFLSHLDQFGLVLAGVLTTLVLGPKALESAVVKTSRPAADRDDRFSRMFSKLVTRVLAETGANRLVVFIDELDRCQPQDVVATLVDLKTFLDEPGCVFVVAADREVLEHALRIVPQAKPIRDTDPYYSTPGAFIDKIFQHQIALPPLRHHALSSFAHGLVDQRTAGVWGELKAADPSGRLFDDVIYVLVPAHVSSPRRVKVLLNNFATSARIAEARDIDWVARATELAVLTVLETEFPKVATALVHFPQILTYVRSGVPEAAAEEEHAALTTDRLQTLRAILNESPSGNLLRDPDTVSTAAGSITSTEQQGDDRKEERARDELLRQLKLYLAKLSVVSGLHDPRPDLLYLRVIGYDDGITDPDLGEMLDMAPDRDPTTVVTAFDDQNEQIRAAAAKLLLQTLSSSRGTGQANVLESACRLVQGLPHEFITPLSYLSAEVASHLTRSTWRPADAPGAIALLADKPDSGTHVIQALDSLDLSEPAHVELLGECVRALAWASGSVAAAIHEALETAVPIDVRPLERAVRDLPAGPALDALQAVDSAVSDHYKAGPTAAAMETFTRMLDAAMASENVPGLLATAIFQAQTSRQTDLLGAIHEQREELLGELDDTNRVAVALYQIEVGPSADWSVWSAYVAEAPLPATETLALWAKDAARVIVSALPTATVPLSNILGPVVRLLPEVVDGDLHADVITQVAATTWGDPGAGGSERWLSMRQVAVMTAGDEGTAKYDAAVSAAVLASVEANLPGITATTVPEAAVTDWCNEVRRLPKSVCADLDGALVALAAPTLAGRVALARVRMAAQSRTKKGLLGASDVLALEAEPTAAAMADEWIGLVPRVEQVLKVHASMPFSNMTLGRYASSLTLARRTVLWTNLEATGALEQLLIAVGTDGVDGRAIEHMRPRILNSTHQVERTTAAERLLTATFNEAPSPAEAKRGEGAGHKEATALALALVAGGTHDNIVLAGRIVIRSAGIAFKGKGVLRPAFSKFANGSQARNFTRDQAKALSELGLLDPKKRSRMTWLWDWLNDPDDD